MIKTAFLVALGAWGLVGCTLLAVQKDRDSAATFSIFQGEVDGHPLFAMIDMGLRNSADKQQLPFFLSLSTHLIDPTSDGLPTRNDADGLNTWEDAVEARLKANTKFVFVGRVTWNGSRELLYYVNSQQLGVDAVKNVLDSHSTRAFSFSCERDEKWKKANFWFNRK